MHRDPQLLTRPSRRLLAGCACAAALVLSASCSTPAATGVPTAPAPAWPAPPAAERVRFLRSVSGPADLGIRKTLLGRLWDAIAGRADERFVRPTGVCAQGETLYVADPGARAVWILNGAANRLSKATEVQTEAGEAGFASPVALALRPDGQLYVADSVLKAVVLLTREGRFVRVAAREGLEQPVAVSYDPALDRLFVADAAAHRIASFDATGRMVGAAGSGGSEVSEFNRPTHLSLESDGTLLVTDALNFRVQAIDRSGRFVWSFGHQGDGSGDLAAPKGVASDRAGHVYVADALFDVVQIFDRDGSFLLAFGGHGDGPGQFWLPNGLFIDARDRIYVADSYNRRIQVFEAVPGLIEGPAK
jgi:DNA-binding beta-propeller fold protein YncE